LKFIYNNILKNPPQNLNANYINKCIIFNKYNHEISLNIIIFISKMSIPTTKYLKELFKYNLFKIKNKKKFFKNKIGFN
jgi:hypothetical protein